MPEISVIVPVYNVEKYINECIESILAQSFEDFELILVDDGSTDSSGAICDRYAERDPRVKVIHKENGGVSSARNVGIRTAKGTYITFVDSDDMVKKTMLMEYHTAMKKNDVDIIISGLIFFYEDTGKREDFCLLEGKFYVKDDFNEKYKELSDRYALSAIYSKLYKNEYIKKNNVRFDERFSILEDGTFVVQYLSCCKSVYCVKDPLYIYRQHSQISLMKKYNHNSLMSLENYISAWNDLYILLDEENKMSLIQSWVRYFIGFLLQVYNRSCLDSREKFYVLRNFFGVWSRLHIKKTALGGYTLKYRMMIRLLNSNLIILMHLILLAKYRHIN